MHADSPRNGNKLQSEAFISAARELGCDESEAVFDAALRQVATAPVAKPEPTPETVAKPARKRRI